MEKARDINVMVRPGSIRPSIEPFGDNRFLIKTNLTNHDQINEEIPRLLATKLGVPAARIVLVNGIDNNTKNFRIVF